MKCQQRLYAICNIGAGRQESYPQPRIAKSLSAMLHPAKHKTQDSSLIASALRAAVRGVLPLLINIYKHFLAFRLPEKPPHRLRKILRPRGDALHPVQRSQKAPPLPTRGNFFSDTWEIFFRRVAISAPSPTPKHAGQPRVSTHRCPSLWLPACARPPEPPHRLAVLAPPLRTLR